MKKTNLKDIPSVDKVLLEFKSYKLNNKNKYLKFLINSELMLIRGKIKKGVYKSDSRDILTNVKTSILRKLSKNLVANPKKFGIPPRRCDHSDLSPPRLLKK